MGGKHSDTSKPMKPELLEKLRQIGLNSLKLPGLTAKRRSEINEDLASISNEQLESAIQASALQASSIPSKANHQNQADWQNFHIILMNVNSNATAGKIAVYSSAETYDDFCQHEYDYMLEEKHEITFFRLEQTLIHQAKNDVTIKFVNFIPSNLNLFDVKDWAVAQNVTRKKIEKSLVTSLGILTKSGFSTASYTKRLFSKLIGVLKKQYSDVILQTDFGGYLVKIGEIQISTTASTEKSYQYLLITSKRSYIFYGFVDANKYWQDLDYQKEICKQLKTFERVISVDSQLPLCTFFFRDEMAN